MMSGWSYDRFPRRHKRNLLYLLKKKKVLHNAPYCTFKVTCPIKLMFIVSQNPQKVQLQCAEFKAEEKNIFSNQCLL